MDVTDHKSAEAALRASEERFRTLVQFSFDVYWETDAQHRFTRQEFSEHLADAPAAGSEIGKTGWEAPYLEPGEEAWREHRATLEAHLPFRDFELARPMPDGGNRYVRWPRKMSAAMDRRVDLDRTLVALVTRLDPSRANRPVLPDAVALTH